MDGRERSTADAPAVEERASTVSAEISQASRQKKGDN